MNTLESYSPDKSWSRSCSRESSYSIQGHETDLARDTTDTEWSSDHEDVEYEPVTGPEDEQPAGDDTSCGSDNEIIATKVIAVSMGDDGGLQLADSEQTAGLESSDSEIDYHDYWLCAHCRADNNNPLYRYCQKCFKVRKNLFPPRPKRKPKHSAPIPEAPPILSQDSGVELNSQETGTDPTDERAGDSNVDPAFRKRGSASVDYGTKKAKLDDTESEINSDFYGEVVKPLRKSISDPAVTIQNDLDLKPTNDNDDNLCITCLVEPKSGVFVHGRIAHICCCYKCAVKVWRRAKRCPVCNSKVSNVLRAVVM